MFNLNYAFLKLFNKCSELKWKNVNTDNCHCSKTLINNFIKTEIKCSLERLYVYNSIRYIICI